MKVKDEDFCMNDFILTAHWWLMFTVNTSVEVLLMTTPENLHDHTDQSKEVQVSTFSNTSSVSVQFLHDLWGGDVSK